VHVIHYLKHTPNAQPEHFKYDKNAISQFGVLTAHPNDAFYVGINCRWTITCILQYMTIWLYIPTGCLGVPHWGVWGYDYMTMTTWLWLYDYDYMTMTIWLYNYTYNYMTIWLYDYMTMANMTLNIWLYDSMIMTVWIWLYDKLWLIWLWIYDYMTVWLWLYEYDCMIMTVWLWVWLYDYDYMTMTIWLWLYDYDYMTMTTWLWLYDFSIISALQNGLWAFWLTPSAVTLRQ
jgi:hypothetical protein